MKSTDRYGTVSLQRFDEKFKERIGQAYVIHTKNFQNAEDIMCLPAYMTKCL